MAKNKFYVVWKGLNPGIYDNWAECKAQVDGQEGAKYKSFENRERSGQTIHYEPAIITQSGSVMRNPFCVESDLHRLEFDILGKYTI